MKRYQEWAPTGFDRKGLNAQALDIGQWYVVPVMQTRDSASLEQSNFDAALAILGGESDTCQVHRFGHWGPGWFEIILLAPERIGEGLAIEQRLNDYPVLDEDDWSDREWKAIHEFWAALPLRERVRYCADAEASIFAARRSDDIPDRVYDRLNDGTF